MAVVLAVGFLPSAAFAAEGESPMVITTADKTNIKPGEMLTITYSIDHDLEYMTRLDLVLRFDATLFQFVSADTEGSVWFTKSGLGSVITQNNESFVRVKQNRNSNEDTISAGKICSITFMALDSISNASTAAFYNSGSSNLYSSSIMVDEDYCYVEDGAFDHGADNPIQVTIAPDGTGPIPTATGYSVSMGADQQLVSGQKVRIPVTVASSEKNITGFNAYDMTFTYDPAALTLNTKAGDAANLTVEDNNGTVRVRRYGATQALGEALALDFTAKATATSTVKLTNAKFDLDANSINFDAPDATISDADTVVNANNFTVTLPDEFTSDAETRLVPGGGSFTFKPVDSHYTYTFTVKMGDTAKEGLTFGADDTYTIENISGNVEVTCTGKTPKQYDVEYVFGDKDPLLEKDVTKGPDKATYLQDYSVTVTPRAGLSYWIHYEIRYPNGTRSDQVSLTPVANADGTITYTIPGSKIDGTVCFIISTRTNDEYPGYAVLVTGNGAEDQAPGNGTSVPRDMPYYLRLNERENCTYTVTAYYQPLSSTSTAANMPAKVRSLGNGKYVVDPIPYNKLSQYAYSWRLVVNVEKVSQNAEEVSVSRYLELNDKTMMLITVKGTPEGGKAFTYDGNTMYKVNAYGTDQYAWLVIVYKGQTLTQEEAAAKVAISAADNVVTITPSFDVNMTGKADVNDAQLVYDMYNGTYSDFTQVSVEKFLRADVNATKAVDHTDAVAIVNQFK